MRWLMYVTLGFAGACACCVWLETGIVWLSLLLVLLVVGSFWINARALSITAMLLLGFGAGQLWNCAYQQLFLSEAKALDGITRTAAIRTSDYSAETAYGRTVDAALGTDRHTYQVRIYLDPGEALEPGQILKGDFRFRLTIPGAEKEGTFHSGEGIFLLAYQEGDLTVEPGEKSRRDLPAVLRRQIKDILEAYFPEDASPFAKALLLGDTADLTYAVDTDLKVSGIRHVAAVSGLHVSILFALISTLTLRRRFFTALLGFPALFLFAALAGFTPSVSRSCLMCALMLLALLSNREYDGPTALSFAVLVILVMNPLAVTSVSLQLSAASVAGIYLFQGKILRWLSSRFREVRGRSVRARFIRWFTGSVSITLSAMVLTTPLCAWYFGMVSLVSVLTNLLTLWVISGIFCGIGAVCLLHLAVPALAGVLAAAVTIPIRYVLWAAHVLARFPVSAVYTVSPYVVAWLVFLGCLLLAFLVGRKRNPALFACCALLGLCAAMAASWTEPLLQDVRFSVLDVGQGQCLLLQTEGKTVLVDCGGDQAAEAADIAAETLLSRGLDHLDVLILTHLDEDHAAGAAHLLTRMDVGLLVMPNMHTDMDTGRAKQILYASGNLELALNGSRVQIYSPGFPGNSNEMSLCVLFDTKKCDILITGDRSGFGERMLLRNAALPKVDVLVAGHHGAADATSEELLAAVRPEIVCISAGAGNPHGHPAPELLDRLEAFGCRVFRTDIQGTITIRR